jgi:uncharacterized FlgJ-related protein
MMYRYDRVTLEFKKIKYSEIFFKTILATVVLFTLFSLTYKLDRTKIDQLTDEEKLIIISDYNEFSEEKLVAKIKELNFRYPHIVLAQAKLETGYFKSESFTYANNLFGMKQAKARANTAVGTSRGHARYDSWIESLYDYALFHNAYLNKLRTEALYYAYLGQNYAEDPKYVDKLKAIVEKQELKNKF